MAQQLFSKTFPSQRSSLVGLKVQSDILILTELFVVNMNRLNQTEPATFYNFVVLGFF
jgi:hypothetical protein